MGSSNKFKLPAVVVDKFFARMQQINAACDIFDLWNDKGLKFERLQGYESRYSMRLTSKYRLECSVEWFGVSRTEGVFVIECISNHYA